MRSLILGLSLTLAFACAAPRPAVDSSALASLVPQAETGFFCRYKLNPWYLPGGELRLGGGQAPFASFDASHRAGVELTMPFGPAAQGMEAVFTSGWVTFRGHYLPKKPFQVSALVPLQFGPVLSFEEGASVAWLGSDEAGRMLVEREAPEHYRPAASLRTTLRCEDTTLGRDFPHRPRAEAAEPRRLLLAAGVDIPVSATPGGAVEGHLRYEQDDWGREAELLEEGEERVRLRKALWPGSVEGWVARSQTAAPAEEGGMGGIFGAIGGLGMRGEGRGTPDHPRCAAEVALYLARDGALVKIGEIHKHAAVLAGEKLPGWTVISLPELDWLKLAPGASWALAHEELARCLPAASGSAKAR